MSDLESDTENAISITVFTVNHGDLPANETFVVRTFVMDGKFGWGWWQYATLFKEWPFCSLKVSSLVQHDTYLNHDPHPYTILSLPLPFSTPDLTLTLNPNPYPNPDPKPIRYSVGLGNLFEFVLENGKIALRFKEPLHNREAPSWSSSNSCKLSIYLAVLPAWSPN